MAASPRRVARGLLLTLSLTAVLLSLGAVRAANSVFFRGNPTVTPADTDADGRVDTLRLAQQVNSTIGNGRTYTVTGYLKDTGNQTVATDTQSLNCPGPCSILFYLNLTLTDLYPSGTYRAVLFLSSSGSPGEVSDGYRATGPYILYPLAKYGLTLSAWSSALLADPGSVATYRLGLTNIGNAPDTYSVAMVATNWTAALGRTTVALYPGATGVVFLNVTVPSGLIQPTADVHTIRATSQAQPALSAQVSVTTTSTFVDLQVAPNDVKVLKPEVHDGDDVPVALTVHNLGTRASPVASLEVQVNGLVQATVVVPSIDPLSSVTVQSTVHAPGGAFGLRVVVDPGNAVAETNESNNQVVTSVISLPVPFPGLPAAGLGAAAAGGLVGLWYLLGVRIEEVMVVHRNGFPVAHLSRTLTPERDADVVASMFTAVQSFVTDSFRGSGVGEVRAMTMGSHRVAIAQGEHIYLAVLYRGLGGAWIRRRARDVVEIVEATFGQKLQQWTGITDEVRGIQSFLEDFFAVRQSWLAPFLALAEHFPLARRRQGIQGPAPAVPPVPSEEVPAPPPPPDLENVFVPGAHAEGGRSGPGPAEPTGSKATLSDVHRRRVEGVRGRGELRSPEPRDRGGPRRPAQGDTGGHGRRRGRRP